MIESTQTRKFRETLARRILQLILPAIFLMLYPNIWGQASSFPIGFPIHDSASNAEISPYSAPIVSVVDHYANPFGKFDSNSPTVIAYTGEIGAIGSLCTNGPPCGSFNLIFNSEPALHFLVNGNFVGGDTFGAGLSVPTKNQSLGYRCHSGIDYGYALGTPVHAADSIK
jgi:hypothetical protein